MKALASAAKWLFILCLPLLLFTASIGWAVNSLWLYRYGAEKYNVSQTTGLTDAQLEDIYTELIFYFNSDAEHVSITAVKDGEPFELFNQREIIHLKDVKGLIRLDYGILLGTLIYVLAYSGLCLFWHRRGYLRQLGWGLVGGGSLTLALMLALGLGTLLGFDQLFWQFHVISFANEFWLLDPATDYLKMLFPQGFFYDTVLFCTLGTAGLAIVLGGVGGYLLLTNRKH
jgi:integral membrane protein (TIGR01906 family)